MRPRCPRLTMLPREFFSAALRGNITAVESWLAQGGDPNEAIEQAISVHTTRPDKANRYAETAKILAGTRLAGHSYKRWVLKDYMALLRVRSLLARGRARHGPETTVVVARLFESLNGFADVPGPCFWRVVEYAWLGEWRK